MAENLPAEKKWSLDQLALIKSIAAPKCTDDEFKLLLYQASVYKLDPLLKQIWAIKYQTDKPASIFAGRDGFLAIAHRSGQFNGIESSPVFNEKGELVGAIAKTWRKDMDHPFVVQVKLSEYKRETQIWREKPQTQILKVAQSQVLRQAFVISGIYSPEEMPEEPKEIKQVPPVMDADEMQRQGKILIHDPTEGDVWVEDKRNKREKKEAPKK